MDESLTKTSMKQRVVIGVIAALMLFSTIAVYALVVIGGNASEASKEENEAKLQEYQNAMLEKGNKLTEIVTGMSNKYYGTLSSYRSYVKAYNEASVNTAGLKTVDYVEGTGEMITAESSYNAYYIGWCADESVFGSSFDNWDAPTALGDPYYVTKESKNLAGWSDGILGMKLGGVREIDVPSELAYGDTYEICGGYNTPLKFIVLAVEPDAEYNKLVEEYNEVYYNWYELYNKVYGAVDMSGATMVDAGETE